MLRAWAARRIVLATLSILALAALWAPGHIHAQSGGWAPPVNLSDSPDVSTSPVIAADQAGQVHVIWAERVNPAEGNATDTLYYRVLSEGVWTQPVDVLAAPFDSNAIAGAFEVSPDGRLVLVWVTNDGLYLSTAPATAASLPTNWTTTTLAKGPSISGPDLAIDRSGGLHVVFVRDQSKVVHIASTASGATWSLEALIGANDRSSVGALLPVIATGADSQVFVSWTRSEKELNWGPAGVVFNRSTDGGVSWAGSTDISRSQGHGASALLRDRRGDLHVFWIGNLQAGGRYHRVSTDEGATWGETRTVVTWEQGRGFAGPAQLAVDGDGNLLAVFGGLSDGHPDSIWYSRFLNQSWTPPVPISGEVPDSQIPTAVIALGNQVNVAWISFGTEDIWYTSLQTDAMHIPPVPLATPETVAVVVRETAPAVPRDLVSPTEEPERPSRPAEPRPAQTNSGSAVDPLLLGLAPAVILVAGVLLGSLAKRSARR